MLDFLEFLNLVPVSKNESIYFSARDKNQKKKKKSKTKQESTDMEKWLSKYLKSKFDFDWHYFSWNYT